MTASLRQIVDSLSARVGQPFDVSLQDELKHIFIYRASGLLSELMDQYPAQREIYSQDAIFELENTKEPICPGVESDCKVFRTKCDIPKPMRTNHDLFLYVGGVNGRQPFQYWPLENAEWLAYNRYTKNRPKFDYINNRVTIYNKHELVNVRIRTVWEDPYSFSACGCATNVVCPNENSPVPYPEDIIATVVEQILRIELMKLIPAQDTGEVKTDVKENVSQNRTTQNV